MNILEAHTDIVHHTDTHDSHQTIKPYIIVNDAVCFTRFLKDVFDAKEVVSIPSQDDNDIMHAELCIGNTIVMLASTGEELKPAVANLCICVPDAAAIFKKALNHGATAMRHHRDHTDSVGAGFVDPFGNTWWLATPR